MIRFSDDDVILAKNEQNFESILQRIKSILKSKYANDNE